MKQKIVGSFTLGSSEVLLVIREGTGGEFWMSPEKGHIPRIKVGIENGWNDMVAIALHEALEMALVECGARFSPAPDHARENGGYLFVMDHTKFACAVAMAGHFLSPALPAMSATYRKWRLKKFK